MILILSKPDDASVEKVMDWLRLCNYPCVRLDPIGLIEHSSFFSLYPEKLEVGQKSIDLTQVHAVWYRRMSNFTDSKYFKHNKKKLVKQAIAQLSQEYNAIAEGLPALLPQAYWLNTPLNDNVNKLQVLNLARQCKLQIPATFIVSTRVQLEQLLKEFALIYKSAYNSIFMKINNGFYTMYTREITQETIQRLDTTFYPSLVQQKIEKLYEIRSFYLEGQFYSMAIFSQQDKQTQVDFRQYNRQNPNRFVPYQLPANLESKLTQLMQQLHLNCGSIDLIKGLDGQFYFLEVNPVGQYGMTSAPCNYNLDQVIAQHLIKQDLAYEKKAIH